MKKALIIEDEKYSADRLRKMIEDHTALKIVNVLYSVEAARVWFDENALPDIIFLDIQLGDGTGFDILDHIQSTFPFIVFTTAFDEYTLKAFKYNSIDYLLKPIKHEELERAVEKFERLTSNDVANKIEDLKRDILKEYRTKFLIKIGLKYRQVTVDEISYFYSSDGTTYLKTDKDDSLILDLSLEVLESSLDPKLYFRINRHMIVKEKSIRSIDSFFNGRLILDLSPGFSEDVIVSRDKVKLFKNWLDN